MSDVTGEDKDLVTLTAAQKKARRSRSRDDPLDDAVGQVDREDREEIEQRVAE